MDSQLAAFRDLYDATFDPVYRFARTLSGDQAGAEELTAQTFLRAWRRPAGDHDRGTTLPWLLATTRRCARARCLGTAEGGGPSATG